MMPHNHRLDQIKYRSSERIVLNKYSAHAALSGRRPINAVRMCSFSTLLGRPFFFFWACAPTRWEAEIWGAIFCPASGRGSGYKRNRIVTVGVTDKLLILGCFPCRLRGYAVSLAREARAHTCVAARADAHTRAVTLLPLSIIHVIQRVSGYRTGYKPVTLVTGASIRRAAPPASAGLSSNLNKIGGRYPLLAADRPVQGQFAGLGRRNFRARIGAAGAIAAWSRSCSSSVDQARASGGRNGGFPGFSAGRSVAVGMASSERRAEIACFPCLVGDRRKLSGLMCGRPGPAPGADGPGGSIGSMPPPTPPSAARDLPTTLTREAIGILIEPSSIAAHAGGFFSRGTLGRPMGSGARSLPASSDPVRKNRPENGSRARGQGHEVSVETFRIGGKPVTLWGGRSHVN